MSLAVHNVVQLSDGDVRDRFVVRGSELDELLAHLSEPDPPRHVLIVGARGMGKSLLLRRLSVAVADDPGLATRWLPVVMAEELYEVTSMGELWLAALARLAAVVSDVDLAAQHRALLAEKDPSRLETMALQRLLAAARARGRRVLLLIENFDMLLGEQVPSEEGWTLRQSLQTEPELLVMASAVTSFTQVEEADEALYGFFHRIDLGPLDDRDVRTLWANVTGVDLAGDRALAIRILTGGNPRLVTVLGRFTQHPDLSHLRQDLELLIDEYTPFFKANIEALPPVERKVFVTLADIWAPATAAEVAAAARLETSTVSALLGRLLRRGAVRIVESEPGRRRYELTERLYNLYHLLRRPSGDGRVRALVDILVHLYEPSELERDIWPDIVERPSGHRAEMDIAIASGLHRFLDDEGVWEDMAPNDLVRRLPVLNALLASQQRSLGDDDPDTLLTRRQIALFTGRSGDSPEALRLYQHVLADQERVFGADHPETLASRFGIAYHTGKAGDFADAVALFRPLAADSQRVLGADHPNTLTSREGIAYYTGQADDPAIALALYQQLADDNHRARGADDPATLTSRHQVAYYTGKVGDSADALALYQQVAADRSRILGPDHPSTLTSHHESAYYTGEAGDAAAAVAHFLTVAAERGRVLGPDHPATLTSRGMVAHYTGRAGDCATALALFRELAADCDCVLGAEHRETLATRYGVAFYTNKAGDPAAALDIANDVLKRIEQTSGDAGRLAGALRHLKGELELRLAADAGRPVPRELRELHEVLQARQGDGS